MVSLTCRAVIVIYLLGSFTGLQALAQLPQDFFSGHLAVERAVFCLYSEKDFKPVAVIRLQKAYTDYERKGFFRIGILPVGVMEGLTFELERPESITNSLAEVHRWLGTRASARLELRNVAFVVPATTTNRLEAGRARLAPHGRLDLLSGVTFLSGTSQITAARGTLQIVGENAGEVVLEGMRNRTNNLFAVPRSITQRP